MRILFLTQVLPFPLDAGPKIRAYYVLRYLCQHHAVTLVSFVRPTDVASALTHLRELCADVWTLPMPRSKALDAFHLARSLITGQPFLIARDWTPAMATLLQRIIHEHPMPFDAIHADQLWMAPYALYARQQYQGTQPSITLDQHNAVYVIPMRMAQNETKPLKRALLHLEARKLARYESAASRKFDHVVWVTGEDYAAICEQAPTPATSPPNADIIPICTDPEAELMIKRQWQAKRVIFLGGLHYPPNAQGICWFAEQVFPQILAHVPDAVLTVIGRQPPTALHRLEIPAANLEVTGFVTDVRPYLAESAAFIVPLQTGGGMRVKILDAWVWGLPLVSTTIGAEGIQVCRGENILIADTATEFAQATVRLLQHPSIGDQMAKAGRKWVEAHYSWQTIYKLWNRIYNLSN